MIIDGSGLGKTKVLLNLISQQDDIDKTYLHGKDLSEPKHEFLIKRHEDEGTKHLNDSNTFIECSNTMDDVYENIDDYNTSRKYSFLTTDTTLPASDSLRLRKNLLIPL